MGAGTTAERFCTFYHLARQSHLTSPIALKEMLDILPVAAFLISLDRLAGGLFQKFNLDEGEAPIVSVQNIMLHALHTEIGHTDP
ncbi:hypothetical protein XMM354_003279 [Aliiroseovarius sp. xm-m-354]|nr:hypothetical protein [Aliiroseovarius sp. xm-m-354]